LSFQLGELARVAEAELHGDDGCEITGVATLESATTGSITFLANPKYRKYLGVTKASAVILNQKFLPECQVDAVVAADPYLAYARICSYMFPPPDMQPGQHESAVVAASAKVDPTAWIGAGVVVEEGAQIGAGTFVGPGSVIGCNVKLGSDSRLVANVTLCAGVTLGERVLLHPGVVVGSDGFGLANSDGAWVKVPQLGSVVIGDDVEIGANTTIDRGALYDTVLERGVKLDNQIQIAHNVRIGEDTAIAGCVGIAGSTKIGRRCTIGGGVGIVGHLDIPDDTHFSAQTLVTRSPKKAGHYSGNLPAVASREWQKSVVHIRHLDDIVRRLKDLEESS
jgi:UDP-3-O-[3-hydroxymyristoyl] glucosamine N-acyltransferase